MKVLIHGKSSKDIEPVIKSFGLNIVTSNPEVVISFGGDGTLLSSERLYPGIAKLPIRNSKFCNKCSSHKDEDLLKKLVEGKLKLREYTKLETQVLYKRFYALNDFVIRNIRPIHTIRFKIIQNSVPSKLFIGDGLVLSTSFGSTGYFKSITGQSFNTSRKEWGIILNNTTEKTKPIYPKPGEEIGFSLVRGQATLSFDNSPEVFTIDEGSQLQFKLSEKVAKIYESTSLRCPKCKVIRE